MAQDVRVLAPEPNHIIGAPLNGAMKSKDSTRSVLVGKTDQIFPQIATGGGWETVMVIVNMSRNTMSYTQRFYSSQGQPMNITFRTYPEEKIVTGTGIEGTLRPGSSFNFALFDSTARTQTGWATLNYDTSAGRLGRIPCFGKRRRRALNSKP